MNPLFTQKVQIGGIYRIRTYTEDGTLTQDTGEFHNLVTNLGLDQYGQTIGVNTRLVVGSGNTTPAFTDTQLQTLVAGVVSSGGTATVFVPATGTQPNYWSQVTTYTFAVGAAAGNLSEIGVGTTNTTLFSRALIVDNTGAPTTITVLPTEILICTYEFRSYIDVTDVSSSYAISTISYATVSRPVSINVPSSPAGGMVAGGGLFGGFAYETQTLSAVTASPAGTSGPMTTPTVATYVTGNHYLDFTATATISQANFTTGIGIITINTNICKWQVQHTPKIPKDNTKTLTLNYRVAWARFTPPP